MAFKYYFLCAVVAAGTVSAGVLPTNMGMDYMNHNSNMGAGNGYHYSNENIPMPSADHLNLHNEMHKPQQMMHHHHHHQSPMMSHSNYDQYNQQGQSFMSHSPPMMKPFDFSSNNNNKFDMMHSNYNDGMAYNKQPMAPHMQSYNNMDMAHGHNHMDMGHGHKHMDMGHGHNHMDMGHEMHNNGFQQGHHQMMMPSAAHGSQGHHHQLLPMPSDINMAAYAHKHTSMPNAIMSDRKGYSYSPSASVSNVAFNGMGTNYKY